MNGRVSSAGMNGDQTILASVEVQGTLGEALVRPFQILPAAIAGRFHENNQLPGVHANLTI